MVTEIWGGIKKKMLRSQYFYNIFTTNHRWLVIISSNLNLTLRLLFFKKWYVHTIFTIFLQQIFKWQVVIVGLKK